MVNRYKHFQFLFGFTTAHELCHTFTCYLSKIYAPGKYTPPFVCHLDYKGEGDNPDEPVGESGRWFENTLLGGSLEFYRDDGDDGDQVSYSLSLVLEQKTTSNSA